MKRMRTVVKVYRSIAPEYAEWRASLGEFARLIEEEVHAESIRSGGQPSGARHLGGGLWEWLFGSGAVVQYRLAVRPDPKVPRPGGSTIARGWRWLKWRVGRKWVRAVMITAIGRGHEPGR